MGRVGAYGEYVEDQLVVVVVVAVVVVVVVVVGDGGRNSNTNSCLTLVRNNVLFAQLSFNSP